jgi:hypothetical protein
LNAIGHENLKNDKNSGTNFKTQILGMDYGDAIAIEIEPPPPCGTAC